MQKFILYRILGNDLPPRHGSGQTLNDLQFIMANEPPFGHCEKRWVVNRIVNHEQESKIIALLMKNRQDYIHIPFKMEEYARCHYNFDNLPGQLYQHNQINRSLPRMHHYRALEYPFRYKNLYVMNNNGARNAALLEGRHLAEWILPWDGQCFLTKAAWESILQDMESLQDEKYLIVPMARVHDNRELLIDGFAPNPVEEPQIIFRRDSREIFDEKKRYGFNPKVDLLKRLGVPGPWDNWHGVPWERHNNIAVKKTGRYLYAGWVARLASEADQSEETGQSRPVARINGIVNMLSSLDEQVLRRKFRSDDLLFYDETALSNAQRASNYGELGVTGIVTELMVRADSLLEAGPYSLLDKTSRPPSGDMHDYLSSAPYWWGKQDKYNEKAGRHDGKRLPETELYSPESNKYDRSRLQLTFDNTTILALAWYFSGDDRYAEQAATLIRTWFLDPDTRMNPHLKYAQIRLGEQKEQLGHGIIEIKDLYFFLDSVRLIFRSAKLSPLEQQQFRKWCREFLGWLLHSEQGKRVFASRNNLGTYYDLQVASLAAFLDDTRVLIQILHISCMRAAQQFKLDGSQPEELKRTDSLSYCIFNLQAWFNLSRIARLADMDLWNTGSKDRGKPADGLSWILSFPQGGWPFRQDSEFDYDRLALLSYLSGMKCSAEKSTHHNTADMKYAIKPVFHPYAGVQPFWCLGLH